MRAGRLELWLSRRPQRGLRRTPFHLTLHVGRLAIAWRREACS